MAVKKVKRTNNSFTYVKTTTKQGKVPKAGSKKR
jgi:hypothetical protein